MTEQLSSESNSEISGISAFIFLHFAGQDQHFGSRVLNFELDYKRNTSLRIVAQSEVTKVLSMWLTTIFLRAKIISKRFKKI